MTTSRIRKIRGGVTAPGGFRAGGIACAIKKPGRPDLAVIISDGPAAAAGTFTTNRVKAAPVRLSMEHVQSPDVRAIIANAGNANACNGRGGMRDARRMTRLAASALGVRPEQVLVCSTGRIGRRLPMEKIEAGIPVVVAGASASGGSRAARAIMTSDTRPKEIALEFPLGRKIVRIGGIAKGAGMIDPNMATMLCFITTDAAISQNLLQKALSAAVAQSFNRITVDGDMSTNDTVLALANGRAGNPPIRARSAELALFQQALNEATRALAWKIVEDGESVTRFVEVEVRRAASAADARRVAEAIANSTLVKSAWGGGDPNWGRILCAAGYSGARLVEENTDIYFGRLCAVRGGVQADVTPEAMKKAVAPKRFKVTVDLHAGRSVYTVYTTDLTPAYVIYNQSE